MSKGNGIVEIKKERIQLIRDKHVLATRNKELLSQNDILEAEKADIVKAYNDLHSACHYSASEYKYLNKSVEELILLNDEKAKNIRHVKKNIHHVKNLNNWACIALSIAAITIICLLGGK